MLVAGSLLANNSLLGPVRNAADVHDGNADRIMPALSSFSFEPEFWRRLCAMFPDLLQLPLEEIFGQHATATLQAIHIHGPALNRVVLDDLVGPFAELHSAFVFDLEADGDDGLEAV